MIDLIANYHMSIIYLVLPSHREEEIKSEI